ncbi:MAG: Hpt domain-containing protein [Aphanothece sp. CMT-3BRIN-NPC111]|nr:Hpt domain-containing protein [Aphanothece sp. CMT-3BRIN-NPC111]
MDSGKQQILYYFIEEAKEHLDTLEKGLLDLQDVMADPERVNEMFRAAHSIKGGAAMLGFGSIQKAGHRLEDCFKILKEHPVKIDQKLESMFLQGYDTLQVLVEGLQGPFGLQEDEAEKTVQEAEPNFAQLQNYLNHLVNNGGQASASPDPKSALKAPASQSSTTPTPNFAAQVTGALRQMLQLFKQQESAGTRQQLEDLCNRLLTLGMDIESWQILVKTVRQAIINPQNSYRTLAPVAIKELKQASELVPAGKANAIAPSPILQQLAASSTPKQISVPVEPRAAAKVLLQTFNQKQLAELVQLLQKAIR